MVAQSCPRHDRIQSADGAFAALINILSAAPAGAVRLERRSVSPRVDLPLWFAQLVGDVLSTTPHFSSAQMMLCYQNDTRLDDDCAARAAVGGSSTTNGDYRTGGDQAFISMFARRVSTASPRRSPPAG